MLVTSPARRSPAGCRAIRSRSRRSDRRRRPACAAWLTALQHVATPLAIVVNRRYAVHRRDAARLADSSTYRNDALCLMLRRGAQVEPFPSIFRADSLPIIQEQFDRGERSVIALTKLPRFTAIDAPRDWSESVWTNLNTPADFVRFIGTESDPSHDVDLTDSAGTRTSSARVPSRTGFMNLLLLIILGSVCAVLLFFEKNGAPLHAAIEVQG